jgi:DNA-binding CsgD family transcriptional regulator
MLLSTPRLRTLSQLFGLLANDLYEREIRQRVGELMLDLMQADHFASYVWDAGLQRFGSGVRLNMDDANLARYDAWYQYHDPITFALQARRHATAVSEVMPHAQLQRTEFFNDFLRRDGLHWGINLHAFDGPRALGDLRIWRARHRRDFDAHDKALLDLIEPAFVAALRRAPHAAHAVPHAARAGGAACTTGQAQALSPREREVARHIAQGLTDKQIAAALGIEVSSVRTYLRRIADKQGVSRRAGIAGLQRP